MLIVGTDRMRVVGAAGAPDGTRHAVDTEGRVLCRASRPRFSWPSLSWDEHRGEHSTCSLCAQVRNAQEALSQVPAYPVGPAESVVPTAAPSMAPSVALVPWRPTVGLFESDES